MSELIEAVKNNDLKKVKELCDSKIIDIDAVDDDGNTALYYAVWNWRINILKILLQYNVDINAKNSNDVTALHMAALSGHLQITKALVKHGAKIDAVSDIGMKPIHYAILVNKNDVAEYLHLAGSNVDLQVFPLRRLLCNVFNNNAVFDLLKNYDTVQMENGGFSEESYQVIGEMLPEFIKAKELDKNKFESLLAALNNKPEETLDLMRTGTVEHTLYATLKENQNPLYKILSIAERGLFCQYLPNSSKTSSLWTLLVPSQYVDKVKKKLSEMSTLNADDAKELLFKDIPRITHCKFKYVDIAQEGFKNGHCYFENLKTTVLSEFIDQFGIKNGKILYKEFDIFMHEQALKKYMQGVSDPNKDEVKKNMR